jgi:hypothetical protein
MLKKTLFTILLTLSLAAIQAKAQDSEDVKARPNKQEVIDLMFKFGKMPADQQKSKLDSLWQDPSASKTPRSDFLFCTGLAFLGNYKAQRCVGSDYERGTGVVEDGSEAYAWYAVALANAPDDAARQSIEADRDRVKLKLLAAYPHPTDDDLDDMEQTLKTKVSQYQADAKKKK